MNSYSCHYFRLINNKLHKESNTACWMGFSNDMVNDIYILFTNKRSEEDLKVMIKHLNIITKCRLEEIKGKRYIVYTPLKSKKYNTNLVLLNFIRMIWYTPDSINIDNFFIDLAKPKKRKETLKFMLECVLKNIEPKNQYAGYWNHSLISPTIIPKTARQLKAYNKRGKMSEFLEKKIEFL